MVESKHYSALVIIAMAVVTLLCIAAIIYMKRPVSTPEAVPESMEYETALFGTEDIITVDIQMEADDWTEMLQDATSEEYKMCDVVINGEKYKKVAVRPKGNTSLFAIAMDPSTDRFSLKIEFDHFIDGQTCHGLDKLILNNGFSDATYMKEAVVFDMYKYIGADASLYNFAKVSVNGEYWGVYTALEDVENSFLKRNYGTLAGKLYKPETNHMDEIQAQLDGDMPSSPPDEDAMLNIEMLGADLNYTDDHLDSYSNIWIGDSGKSGSKDRRRVVTAIKNISSANEIERYLDVDNVLKYMAVHTFAVNMDGLSGMMGHNYYLYEYDGKLNILPWDYNLAFGGMSMSEDYSATDVVNFAIDTPFEGTKFFDALLTNDEYRERYHEYLKQLTDEYVNGGGFDKFYNRVKSQIDELVEEDPTAFYSYDEYLEATDTLYELIQLRADSIDGQISGEIPSTKTGQEGSDALIDASHIKLETSGQFAMAGDPGGEFDMEGGFPGGEFDMEGGPQGGQFDMEGGPPGGQFNGGGPPGGQMMPMGELKDPRTGIPILMVMMIKDLVMCLALFVMVLVAILAVRRVNRR